MEIPLTSATALMFWQTLILKHSFLIGIYIISWSSKAVNNCKNEKSKKRKFEIADIAKFSK